MGRRVDKRVITSRDPRVIYLRTWIFMTYSRGYLIRGYRQL
jgi:hypothetical protein